VHPSPEHGTFLSFGWRRRFSDRRYLLLYEVCNCGLLAKGGPPAWGWARD